MITPRIGLQSVLITLKTKLCAGSHIFKLCLANSFKTLYKLVIDYCWSQWSPYLPHGLNFRSRTGFLKLKWWRTVFVFKLAKRHLPSVKDKNSLSWYAMNQIFCLSCMVTLTLHITILTNNMHNNNNIIMITIEIAELVSDCYTRHFWCCWPFF